MKFTRGSTGERFDGTRNYAAGTIGATIQTPINPKSFPWLARFDGTTDDTAALQAAINTGAPINWPDGVARTTETLTINTAASHGQRITGAGPRSQSNTGSKCTVIKPDSGVSVALEIDGAAFSGWVQHLYIEQLTVDMANMTDAAASIAVSQKNSFGVTYDNVRAVNQGANKRGFLLGAGAYTTTLRQCTAQIIEFGGDGDYISCPTTMLLENCDFQQVKGRWFVCCTVFGGAVQGARDKFDVDHFDGLTIVGLDIEGSGTYLQFGANAQTQNVTSIGNFFSGFSGSYKSAYPSAFYRLMDDAAGRNAFSENVETTLDLVAGGKVTSAGAQERVDASAALTRNLVHNTNAAAQQVDTQYQNEVGSAYVGVDESGKAFVNAHGGAGAFLQVVNVDKLGVNADDELVVATERVFAANEGAVTLVPTNCDGFVVVNYGGNRYGVPLFPLA